MTVRARLRLFGAAAATLAAVGSEFLGPDRTEYDANVDAVRSELSAREFGAAWVEGNTFGLTKSIDYALNGAAR